MVETARSLPSGTESCPIIPSPSPRVEAIYPQGNEQSLSKRTSTLNTDHVGYKVVDRSSLCVVVVSFRFVSFRFVLFIENCGPCSNTFRVGQTKRQCTYGSIDDASVAAPMVFATPSAITKQGICDRKGFFESLQCRRELPRLS